MRDVWERALSVQQPLAFVPAAATGLVVLALVVLAWRPLRILVTVCHEAGHAVVGVLVGRRLAGIRLRSDTSGVTVTKGRPHGPGMVATLFAGYPAASVVGLGAAWLASTGHAAGLLWLLVVLLALMLLSIRNLYGALVVVVGGAAVALASWYAPPALLAFGAYGLAWLFLLGGPRAVVEVMRSATPQSDPGQLSRLTRVPRPVWGMAWLVLTVACLAAGAWLLLPVAAV
ncbi:M50 family metallopeptidase [Propionicicella superfundia]|uniref:M50 family metallopeptidase n=1 Tax=Propionicicella superfundia TaxID=348582 RepID=UPI000684CCBB|nr:M50 family metallopeptidase [Propionicicella superfundia]